MRKVKNDKFNKCREFGGQGCPPYDTKICHCEKRSDEAIQRLQNLKRLTACWIASSFLNSRNDGNL